MGPPAQRTTLGGTPSIRTVCDVQIVDIATIPERPGCYQFFEQERCLYVGKAVNLRQRLTSYLSPRGPDDVRIAEMVRRADRVEWVVLGSESDALLTEAAMIASLDPVYNIRLREDHPYPSVALDARDGVVKITSWRGAAKADVEVFGPFPGASARRMVDAVLTVAPVRSCDRGKFTMHQRMKRACMLADVGRCAAPCVNDAPAHDAAVDTARSILRGSTGPVLASLDADMRQAAVELRFEYAGLLRDRIAAVNRVNESRLLDDGGGRDLEVVGTHIDGVGGAAAVMSIRKGMIVRTRYFVVDAGIVSDGALLSAALECCETGRTILARGEASGVARTARLGKDKRLVAVAETNAVEALRRSRMLRASTHDARRAELARLQEALGLAKAPLRIEAVDISHLGGKATVSVVALLVDGVPMRNRYRKYRLKEHGGDDYAAMREVLTRRITDSIDGKAPYMDLLLIDGGASQLAVAVEVLNELGVAERVAVASLAKRLEEVFLPGREEPVVLQRDDVALLLLQRARDETHAASNRFQQQVASKQLRKDYLDGIAGLGSARKKVLLERCGGWRGLEEADRGAVDAVSTIPTAVRDRVWAVLEQRRSAPGNG